MSQLLREIKDDLRFIKSHTLQPKWYKSVKIFILAGLLVGYGYLFGVRKTTTFFCVFMLLSLGLHLLYRAKTNKWRRSWLDFVVIEENNQPRPASIGKFYYSAVVVNAVLALVISQLVTWR